MSHPAYHPFSSIGECIDSFYEYVTVLQNSDDWLKNCQIQFCNYWNDTHKFYTQSEVDGEFRCNSSRSDYQRFISYPMCVDEFLTYASSIQDL